MSTASVAWRGGALCGQPLRAPANRPDARGRRAVRRSRARSSIATRSVPRAPEPAERLDRRRAPVVAACPRPRRGRAAARRRRGRAREHRAASRRWARGAGRASSAPGEESPPAARVVLEHQRLERCRRVRRAPAAPRASAPGSRCTVSISGDQPSYAELVRSVGAGARAADRTRGAWLSRWRRAAAADGRPRTDAARPRGPAPGRRRGRARTSSNRPVGDEAQELLHRRSVAAQRRSGRDGAAASARAVDVRLERAPAPGSRARGPPRAGRRRELRRGLRQGGGVRRESLAVLRSHSRLGRGGRERHGTPSLSCARRPRLSGRKKATCVVSDRRVRPFARTACSLDEHIDSSSLQRHDSGVVR